MCVCVWGGGGGGGGLHVHGREVAILACIYIPAHHTILTYQLLHMYGHTDTHTSIYNVHTHSHAPYIHTSPT